jgi:hypothetical protein
MRADGLVREIYLPHPPHAAGAVKKPPGPRRSLRSRMRGPGGWYNAGNAIGISTGLAMHFAAAAESAGAAQITFGYFAGSSSALAVTMARVFFITAGECYYLAWRRGFPPVARLTVLGDFLSGIAALILGYGLFTLGEPVLAMASGLLQAFGKFGSAFDTHSRSPKRQLAFRLIVLFSRFPALVLCSLALIRGLPAAFEGSWLPAGEAASFLVCYLIWVRADWLLVRAK